MVAVKTPLLLTAIYFFRADWRYALKLKEEISLGRNFEISAALD